MFIRRSWKRLDDAFEGVRRLDARVVITITDPGDARRVRRAYRAMRRAGLDRTIAHMHMTSLLCASPEFRADPREVSA